MCYVVYSKPVWKDGTTAILVLVINETMYIANIGDSQVRTLFLCLVLESIEHKTVDFLYFLKDFSQKGMYFKLIQAKKKK